MPSADRHPEVIARPPFIWAAFLAAGSALEVAWPSSVLAQTAQYAAGLVLFTTGLGIAGSAIWRFRSARTNVPTSLPATALVTGGPYRLTRNPIYLGMALGTLGIGSAVDSLWIMGLTVPLTVVLHFGVVLREERYLEDAFGDAYRRYRASVRRWV